MSGLVFSAMFALTFSVLVTTVLSVSEAAYGVPGTMRKVVALNAVAWVLVGVAWGVWL